MAAQMTRSDWWRCSLRFEPGDSPDVSFTALVRRVDVLPATTVLYMKALYRLKCIIGSDNMPNYTPKGAETMRKLARTGGLKSAETRRRTRDRNSLMESLGRDPIPAAMLKAKPPNRSGGSPETDWRCPQCRHFNSIKRRMCAKCGQSPVKRRLTRKALRVRAEEHRVQAILRKHRLDGEAA